MASPRDTQGFLPRVVLIPRCRFSLNQHRSSGSRDTAPQYEHRRVTDDGADRQLSEQGGLHSVLVVALVRTLVLLLCSVSLFIFSYISISNYHARRSCS